MHCAARFWRCRGVIGKSWCCAISKKWITPMQPLVLACPIGTVRSRLHRARALLLEKLHQERNFRPAVGSMEAGKVFDMSCQEFWRTMPELARHPDQSGHLRECSACAALWEKQRALTDGLRTVAKEWSHLQAPQRLEGRLTAAFRSHAGLGEKSRPERLWVPAAAWFAAAPR